MFEPGFKVGAKLHHDEIIETFKCGNMGGMRRSKATNTLVLVSDPFKGLYEDRWHGEVLYYTGMGKKGDQVLAGNQNKTLCESKTNLISVHLFEVFKPHEYTYIGPVTLAEEAFQEDQLDEENKLRKVWVFPLKVEQGNTSHIAEIDFVNRQKNLEEKAKKARKKSLEELKKRALSSAQKAGKRTVETCQHERDPYVVEYVKLCANGICDLCGSAAPFKSKSGEPYLELHHIVWLSKGGDDTVSNAAALCPNCHRKMHSLNLQKDRNKLLAIATDRMMS